MPRGGFQSVDLNAVGWAAAIGPTALIGAGIGYWASHDATGAALGAVLGGAGGVAAARMLDAYHARRQWTNVAVADSDEAAALLHRSGIAAAPGLTVVDNEAFHYVTVRMNDHAAAVRLVGVRAESVRGRRRARKARITAGAQPTNPPAR